MGCQSQNIFFLRDYKPTQTLELENAEMGMVEYGSRRIST